MIYFVNDTLMQNIWSHKLCLLTKTMLSVLVSVLVRSPDRLRQMFTIILARCYSMMPESIQIKITVNSSKNMSKLLKFSKAHYFVELTFTQRRHCVKIQSFDSTVWLIQINLFISKSYTPCVHKIHTLTCWTEPN